MDMKYARVDGKWKGNRLSVFDFKRMVKEMLTKEQSKIIISPPGRTVVFAAPGSGKTTVLTSHISEQLRAGHLRAREIMAITFTRQSAADMKRRMMQLNGLSRKVVEALQIGTFHAQLFRMLLKTASDIPVLLSAREQYELMKLSVERCSGNRYRISRTRVQQSLNNYSVSRASYPPKNLAKQESGIVNTYMKLKRSLNRWDFDDILQTFCSCIETREKKSLLPILKETQYLLVDEYQDTNAIQWTILQQFIFELNIPIFVVGDDDQSIYGFRGASPEFLLSFAKTFEDAKQHNLDYNFRSSPEIVEHARQLIEHNQLRTDKQMKAVRTTPGHVKAFQVGSEDLEAQYVITTFAKIKKAHPEWTCAVLSRTRRQLFKVWSKIREAELKGLELRTFHDAKGKEWDALFIVGFVDKNPYLARMVTTQSELEEERRLYYVALTRAKTLSYTWIPKNIAGYTFKPSPFITEAKIPIETI